MSVTNLDLEAAELFRKEMDDYMKSYSKILLEKVSKSTVRKHSNLIGFFIDELEVRYGVQGFEQITLGMCGSKLVSTYNSTCDERLQLSTVKNILYGFFQFIYTKYGIANHELLHKLKR